MCFNDRKQGMSKKVITLLLLIAVCILIVKESLVKRPEQLYQTTAGQVEMCLFCHQKEKLDPAHDTKTLGCSPCHLGDSLAIDKEKAHKGIVNNPGDLRIVAKTCGTEGCHAIDIKKIKNSLMATNRGILATLLYYWGEAPDQNGDYSVEKLMAGNENSLALDYYRKLCATCHLWKQKGDLPGVFGEKGGGCTACHHVMDPTLPTEGPEKGHPLIVKKVPVENCVRCHNRSGRIGISYTGVYESEGYGTPYENGQMSKKQLPGDRFFLDLPADVHFRKGMACIDCHTRNEIMGDGTSYAHFEEQLEVHCKTCHGAEKPGLTAKGYQMAHVLKEEDGKVVMIGKLDEKKYPVKPPKPGACDYLGHERLSCQACHSAWVPQCYGCHVKRDMSETHLDKLTLKETPGWWEEGRSYIRFEQPALGIWQGRIMPVTPGCQDIVTLLDEAGKEEKGFNSFTMAAIDPHTTQTASRTCADCHASTKSVGLGTGTAWRQDGEWRFDSVDMGVETAAGQTPPLDAFVSIEGVPLQKSFRPSLRPFNKDELSRILRIGQCLPCHKTYDDKAYVDYSPIKKCPVFQEE